MIRRDEISTEGVRLVENERMQIAIDPIGVDHGAPAHAILTRAMQIILWRGRAMDAARDAGSSPSPAEITEVVARASLLRSAEISGISTARAVSRYSKGLTAMPRNRTSDLEIPTQDEAAAEVTAHQTYQANRLYRESAMPEGWRIGILSHLPENQGYTARAAFDLGCAKGGVEW